MEMSTGIHEPRIARDNGSDEIRHIEIAFGPDCVLRIRSGLCCPTLTLRVGDLEAHLNTDGQHSAYRRAVNMLRLRMSEVRTAPREA
jgi:hypothetical protein